MCLPPVSAQNPPSRNSDPSPSATSLSPARVVASYAAMSRSGLRLRVRFAASAILAACGFIGVAASSSTSRSADPLADDIARWSKFLAADRSADEMWKELKEATAPAMARTEEAMRDGHWYLALQRLAPARGNLDAQVYMDAVAAKQRGDLGAFEAEWSRLGKTLALDLRAPSPAALDGVTPAAV